MSTSYANKSSGGVGSERPSSGSVVGETSFGLPATAGDANSDSRGNHSHGTPDDPVPPHVGLADPHTQYALDSDLFNHDADTTGIHGIADTAALVLTGDARLSDARTPTAHAHPESDVTNLTSDLSGKAAAVHGHVESDTTGLVADLAGKAASTHTHSGADITSGTVADGQIATTIARDSEVSTAVSDHAALPDPHTGYRLESADHSHATTGLQAGTISHDVLTGVSADDHHPQVHDIDGADHNGFPGGTSAFLRADGVFASPTASVAFSPFSKDLGVAKRTGTFDITGLAGLTADKPVTVMQTAAAIASKGNARDEPEMDQIQVTGYVVDAATIRCFWQAPAVVVGTYAFAYLVGA